MAHVEEALSSVGLSPHPADSRTPTQIDRHVGQRLRTRRVMLGITQQDMAELLGVSYQQAHKYEKGTNRISAARLHQIARVLGVEVDFFFEGLGRESDAQEFTSHRLFLELCKTVEQLRNEAHREAIFILAKALTKSENVPKNRDATAQQAVLRVM